VLAIISWTVLEQPFLRLKRLFELRRRKASPAVANAEISVAPTVQAGQAS
jgi:peptidoglycan/LPS O-acetylase OafA/YrhL